MSDWLEAAAPAKLNFALVVGPLRVDGKHEVVTVLERLDAGRRGRPARGPRDGRRRVRRRHARRHSARGICAAAGTPRRFGVAPDEASPGRSGARGRLERRGDGARARQPGAWPEPLGRRLHDLAAELGADVPFFLQDGPQLATGDGTTLEPLELPRDYSVLLVLRDGDRSRRRETSTRPSMRGRAPATSTTAVTRSARAVGADPVCARPCGAPAERPRLVAPRRGAAGAGRVPRRRVRRRAGRLRALRDRRRGRAGRRGAREAGQGLGHGTDRPPEMNPLRSASR